MLVELTIPVAAVGEDQAVSVLVRQSDTMTGTLSDVVGATTVLPVYAGVERVVNWDAGINVTKYNWFFPVTAAGAEGRPTLLLPQVALDVVQVVVATKDCFGVVLAGLAITVSPCMTGNAQGGEAFLAGNTAVTDAGGLYSFDLRADSGTYRIQVGDAVRNFNTAGRGGTTVAFADLL